LELGKRCAEEATNKIEELAEVKVVGFVMADRSPTS
jgi:hypothetical protein